MTGVMLTYIHAIDCYTARRAVSGASIQGEAREQLSLLLSSIGPITLASDFNLFCVTSDNNYCRTIPLRSHIGPRHKN